VTTKDDAPLRFALQRVAGDDPATSPRAGVLSFARGDVPTPCFMPVGTQGTVKGVAIDPLRATGARMILGNTYHLSLRPGEEIVRELGGLHVFSGWSGPILTDSGGFQVFSLADISAVSEKSVRFKSHIDGRMIDLSPERSIEIQEALGSDVAMVLDHVVKLPSSEEAIRDACDRSIRWAARCRDYANRSDQSLFAIVQGGLDPALRAMCAQELSHLDFPGYAIGGLSVGEPPPEMYAAIEATAPHLPAEKPRYLMGVGRPEDLVEAIGRGVDMFDCVMPTRNGRNALAFTDAGTVRLRNAKHARDPRPLEAGCPCPACGHSRGYLRHLFQADEMLGPILLSIHNLTYYQRLVRDCREAILADAFEEFREAKYAGYRASERGT
jgi:queuine tRNA-ribosyltransferase